jgi:hypothetical protein
MVPLEESVKELMLSEVVTDHSSIELGSRYSIHTRFNDYRKKKFMLEACSPIVI